MVDQATLNESNWSPPGSRRESSAAVGVRNGVGELVHDIVTLSELQMQLLSVDANEGVQKAKSPLLLVGVGIGLALGSLPVLLLALAECLVLWLHWERGMAYLLSGLVGVAIGGGLIYSALQQLGALTTAFDRSRAELADNIRWIKYALTRGRRPPR